MANVKRRTERTSCRGRKKRGTKDQRKKSYSISLAILSPIGRDNTSVRCLIQSCFAIESECVEERGREGKGGEGR